MRPALPAIAGLTPLVSHSDATSLRSLGVCGVAMASLKLLEIAGADANCAAGAYVAGALRWLATPI